MKYKIPNIGGGKYISQNVSFTTRCRITFKKILFWFCYEIDPIYNVYSSINSHMIVISISVK